MGLRGLFKTPARHSIEWRVGMGVALVALAAVLHPVISHANATWRLGYDKAEVPCMPHRTYLITLEPVTPTRGDIVAFRTRGLAPIAEDGTVYTKQVLGLPGEEVVIDAAGATVGGQRLLFTDRALRKLKTSGAALARRYRLAKDEYFMAGTSPTAYDSRYYGPVKADQFMGSARPLW